MVISVNETRRAILSFAEYHYLRGASEPHWAFEGKFKKLMANESNSRNKATLASHVASMVLVSTFDVVNAILGRVPVGTFVFEDDVVVDNKVDWRSKPNNCSETQEQHSQQPKRNLQQNTSTQCPTCRNWYDKEDNACDAMVCSISSCNYNNTHFCFYCGEGLPYKDYKMKGHGSHYCAWQTPVTDQNFLRHSPTVLIGHCGKRWQQTQTERAQEREGKEGQEVTVRETERDRERPRETERDRERADDKTVMSTLQQVEGICGSATSPVWLAGRIRPPGKWQTPDNETRWQTKGGNRVRACLQLEAGHLHDIAFEKFSLTCCGALYYPYGQAEECIRKFTSVKTKIGGHVDLVMRKHKLVRCMLYKSPFGVCDRLALEPEGKVVYHSNTGCRDNGHGAVLGFDYNSQLKDQTYISTQVIPKLAPPYLQPKVLRTHNAVGILDAHYVPCPEEKAVHLGEDSDDPDLGEANQDEDATVHLGEDSDDADLGEANQDEDATPAIKRRREEGGRVYIGSKKTKRQNAITGNNQLKKRRRKFSQLPPQAPEVPTTDPFAFDD